MDLSPFGYPSTRKTVVVLGAGATRGVSFGSSPSVVRPPLDADFFAQLRASHLAEQSDTRLLLEFIQREFGDADPSMETFYSQVHLHDQFIVDLPRGRGRRRMYRTNLRRFLQTIPAVFELALGDATCEWHHMLAGSLNAGDTVISFNYDCVMDYALRDSARRRWSPETGYGVEAGGNLAAWTDHKGRGRLPQKPVRLLKLHGSLNWDIAADAELVLNSDIYRSRSGEQLCIVPPLWQKTFDEPPFHDIWLAARRELTATRALLVIGYSLPLTDVYTQALLRIDLEKLDFLLIANPDGEARGRIRYALRSAVSSSTRIVELETMQQVGVLLGESRPSATRAREMGRTADYVIDLLAEILEEDPEREKRFSWARGDPSPKTGKRVALPFDAVWEPRRLIIEVDEDQHRSSVPFWDKPDVMTVSGVSRGEQRRRYDERKRAAARREGYVLIEIPWERAPAPAGRDREADTLLLRHLLAEGGVAL